MHSKNMKNQSPYNSARSDYFLNMYQKSNPCASIKKWSTAKKYATQITTETNA